MPAKAIRYAGLPPKSYGMSSVLTRRVLSRIQPLIAPAAPLMRREGSSVNMNPIPVKSGNVLSSTPTIASGEVHKLEPVQLRFSMGQRWMGFALLALVAFSLFRK